MNKGTADFTAKVDKEQLYYHFYEYNSYKCTVQGKTKAEAYLRDICLDWQFEHGNFWSDSGDIETSIEPGASSHNYCDVMEEWVAAHPGWRYTGT